VGDLPVRWTDAELLAEVPGLEALVIDGRRCHGGLDTDGRYRSPRTRFRLPAIAAWQAQHAEQFGTDLLDVGLDTWPAPSPTVAQTRFLLERGVREPIVAALTRIGTVEGFGGAMRLWAVPDLQRHVVEPITDTTLDHLAGMFEAQARDEAGHDDELGHRDLWFLARDLAFESPDVEDLTDLMLFRLGVTPAPGAPAPTPEEVRARLVADQQFPVLPLEIESLLNRMIGLLLIEISAAHLFSWAETVLADDTLVAGDGEAARIVSFIRQDESPHVEYLRTALSELRDRTFVAVDGTHVAGAEVVGHLWARSLADSVGPRRANNLRLARAELDAAVAGRRDRDELVAGYDALAAAV
jgi:hypothetical protein